jgi:hypothetical protein
MHGRVVYNILVGKPESKRALGRLRSRWEDNTHSTNYVFPLEMSAQRNLTTAHHRKQHFLLVGTFRLNYTLWLRIEEPQSNYLSTTP